MISLSLEIYSDNEGMQEPSDIVAALRNIAERIENGKLDGIVWDVNGNRVGTYSVDQGDEDEEESEDE